MQISVNPKNEAPSSNAGEDQTIDEQSLVTLSGQGIDTDGVIESYLWEQMSGTLVALESSQSNISTFISPTIVESEYITFNLIVTDNEGLSASDEVRVKVVPNNNPPVVDAGVNKSVKELSQVSLLGHVTDADGTIDDYLWSQVSGQNVVITDSNIESASFIAPDVIDEEVLIFELTATDNENATGVDRISITVIENELPVADAGVDQNITSGSLVQLDASNSTDLEGTVSFNWLQVDSTGIKVALSDVNSEKPDFTSPILLSKQTVSFELTVTDEAGLTDIDQVDIAITPTFSTAFSPSNDSKIIYVSSQSGDDATGTAINASEMESPTNPNVSILPYKTLSAAISQLRDGYPDWILLNRGDTWNNESFGIFSKSGRALSEPMVLGFYGSSGQRPLIKTGRETGLNSAGRETSNLAIIGLDFYANARDPNSADFIDSTEGSSGLRIVGSGENILIEDTVIRFFGTNLNISEYNGYHSNVSIKRCIILDSYGYKDISHSSGIYISGVDGILMEDNIFDHNGWNSQVSEATSTVFNHNVYIQWSNVAENITVKNNVSTRSSNHAIKGRPGGVYTNNLFAENPIGFEFGYNAEHPIQNGSHALVQDNVILAGKQGGGSKAIWGIEVDKNALDWGGTIELTRNIVANVAGTSESMQAIILQDGVVSNDNIIYKWAAREDMFDPSWPNPDISIDEYMSSIGEAPTLDAYLNLLRNRNLGEWDERLTSPSVNNYIRSGFNR